MATDQLAKGLSDLTIGKTGPTDLSAAEPEKKVIGGSTKHGEGDPEASEESKNDDPAIRMGLLNVHGIEEPEKRERLCELITERKLEVFFSTDTGLNGEAGEPALREALIEASPEGYQVFHQPWEQGEQGRGVGIQVSPRFTEVTQDGFNLPQVTTFEYVAKILKHNNWDQEVLFINLYRPPNSSKAQFQKEFEGLLKDVSEKHHSVVITGDFNIWVDEAYKEETKNKSKQQHAEEFLQLLRRYNFDQHVNELTYWSGHTLDLVISRKVEISELTVHHWNWSDHKFVVFKARPVSQGKN